MSLVRVPFSLVQAHRLYESYQHRDLTIGSAASAARELAASYDAPTLEWAQPLAPQSRLAEASIAEGARLSLLTQPMTALTLPISLQPIGIYRWHLLLLQEEALGVLEASPQLAIYEVLQGIMRHYALRGEAWQLFVLRLAAPHARLGDFPVPTFLVASL